MRKKKTLIFISALGASVLALSSFAIIGKKSDTFHVFADKEYTCALPDGYVEIEDAITEAISNGDVPVANTLKFRGTITAISGNYAYMQRRNQTNYWTDGIRIKGVEDNSLELAVGNVVDVRGGYLYLEYGNPTLLLNDEEQYVVSFADNPTGYDPIVYQTYQDYDYNGFRNTSDRTHLKLDYNKLITIKSLKVDYWNSGLEYPSLFDGNSTMYFECSWPEEPLGSAGFYIETGDYDDNWSLMDTVINAYNDGEYIDVTCYMTSYNDDAFPFLLHVARLGDIEIGGPAYDTSVFERKETSKLYFGVDSYNVGEVYYLEDGDIPYVDFLSFYTNLFLMSFGQHQDVSRRIYKYNWNHGSWVDYRSYDNNSEIYIDAVNNRVEFYTNTHLPLDIRGKLSNGVSYLINGGDKNCSFNVEASVSHVAASETKSFNLGSYGIDIIMDSYDNPYIPLVTACDMLVSTNGIAFSFNGKDLYYTDALDGTENELKAQYYNDSPFLNTETMGSVEYCEYAYNEFCFAIDNCYGLLEERGETSADALFKKMGLDDDLKSTDRQTYEDAITEFCGKWLFEGHAGYTYRSPRTGDITATKSYAEYLDEYNDRYHQLIDTRAQLQTLRASEGSDSTGEGLRMFDDVAVITFDSFTKFSGDASLIDLDDYSYSEINNILGSDMLFRKAFNDIEANPDIKYVVIDLSINGGGLINAIPHIEAYMTDDPFVLYRNRTTGEVFENHFIIDLDRDGDVDGDDTYKGKYEFFMLTSRFSFSCGNMLPTFVKSAGMATIFGKQSGGGECSVGAMSSAHGAIFRSSSPFQGGSWDEVKGFVGNESGVPVDYNFEYEDFYNNAALRTFILAHANN